MNSKRWIVSGSILSAVLVGIVAGAPPALVAQITSSGANSHVIPIKVNGSGDIMADLLLEPGATAPHSSIGRGTAGLGHYHGIGLVRVACPTTNDRLRQRFVGCLVSAVLAENGGQRHAGR